MDDVSAFLLDDSEWPERAQPGGAWSRPTLILAERALIGAALLIPELFDAVKTHLSGEHFSHRARSDVWETIRTMRHHGRAIDPVTVARKLEVYGVPAPAPHAHWHAALGALLDDGTSICGDPALMREYAAIVVQAAAERRTKKPA